MSAPTLQPTPTIHFCTCSHSKLIHTKKRNKYGSNNVFLGSFSNGCRAANCDCRYFRLKSRLRQLQPRERRSFLEKVKAAVGL